MPTIRLQSTFKYWQPILYLVLFTLFLIPQAHAVDTPLYQLSKPSPDAFRIFGQNTSNAGLIFKFTPQNNWLYCYFKIKAETIGTPADNFTWKINTDFNGVNFVGSTVASGSFVGNSIAQYPSTTDLTIALPNCSYLPAYKPFYLNFSRDGGTDNSNYYQVEQRTTPPDALSQTYLLYYGTWTLETWTLGIDIYGNADLSGSGIAPPASSSYNFSNNDFGALGNMFRDVISWLFVPSIDSYNQYLGLWDMVKTKPPVGYLTATISAFNGLSYASGSYYLTFSGLDSGNSPLAMLKTGLTWILWFMLAFWIFNRLRHLAL